MRQLRLTGKLTLILALGLVCLLVSGIVMRTLIELPALRHLEFESDSKDIRRVQLFLEHVVHNLAVNTAEYSAWDDTYDVVTLEPGEPDLDRFAGVNLLMELSARLDIDGVVLIDSDGTVKINIAYETGRRDTIQTRGLDPDSLTPAALRSSPGVRAPEQINAGLSTSNVGPVLFAAARVLPSVKPYPASRGTLIFWRRVNDNLVDFLAERTESNLNLIPIAEARGTPALSTAVRTLEARPELVHTARDDHDRIFWLLRDLAGTPLYVVDQKAVPRSFFDGWLSPTFVMGFTVSSLVLLAAGFVLARSIIRRLRGGESVIQDIVENGDFALRLSKSGRDEIDALFERFNQMLAFIQVQEERLKTRNEHLELLSEQDALTGIPNRRYLDRTLESTLRQSARLQVPMSLLMIDVDHFKSYNDSYGHQNGDMVLKEIAQRLRHMLGRATDRIARYGGEEFSAILLDVPLNTALQTAERLRSAIEELRIENRAAPGGGVITVSIGVSTATPGIPVSEQDLLSAADQALYEAKNAGRNRVVARNPEPMRRGVANL